MMRFSCRSYHSSRRSTMSNTAITVLGLCLDIIGVLLLWKFELPLNVADTGVISWVSSPEVSERDKRTRATYKKRAHVAIILIVLGFALQVAGTLLPASFCKRTQVDFKTHSIAPAQQFAAMSASLPVSKNNLPG